jgi:hypothetical protein
MRLSSVCSVLVLLIVFESDPPRAQGTSVPPRTTAGTHTVTFATPQGTVQLHVSSDAASGDVISGQVAVEPAGATQPDRDANRARLMALSLEFEDQRTPVANAHYEWTVPALVLAGSAPVSLRDADNALIARSPVPIDPVPAARPRGGSRDETLDLPAEAETGRSAIVRGRFDGGLAGATVTVAGAEATLLAASPRQLAFRVPANVTGPVPIRIASDGRAADGTIRVFDVRLSASRTQLFRNQRAELTVTVSGLAAISEPVTLSLANQSPGIVRIDGIDRPVTIAPGQVSRAGTYTTTRRLTGIEPGPFQVAASVGRPPLSQFDLPRSMSRILDDWYATTGVGITPDANDLVQRSVLAARTRLNDFLLMQRAHQGDVQEVFAALLSHYCFDLRDEGIARTAAAPLFLDPFIRPVALGQGRTRTVEITPAEVRRQSFSDYLSRLVSRFTARQAVGYLYVRSMPAEAPITIDGERRGELTNRRLVAPAGDHQITVGGSTPCRQRVTVNPFQTEVVDCAGGATPPRLSLRTIG